MSGENTKVPLLDLKAQFDDIRGEIMPLVNQVFEQQSFILGPWVQGLEKALAEHLGVRHAVGVSSGTDALLLSLMTLGIGPGDGVITTPFTFFATAGSIVRTGAAPLFADIQADSFNLDPESVRELLARKDLPVKPRAIMPVHLFGQPAPMEGVLAIAKEHHLAVVEDAAQAIGVKYPSLSGQVWPVGGMGHLGCFSFFPSKNLGGAGDGGLVTTNDDELAARLTSMRTHGSSPKEKYLHLSVGGNFRLDALQAAVIQAKLPHLEDWSAARRQNAADYDRMFADSGLVDKGVITTPPRMWPDLEQSHVYNQYTLRCQNRDGLQKALQEASVGCAVYYPMCLHMQPCFEPLGYKEGDLPVSEKAAGEVLSIPIYPELSMAHKERVVSVISDFYA